MDMAMTEFARRGSFDSDLTLVSDSGSLSFKKEKGLYKDEAYSSKAGSTTTLIKSTSNFEEAVPDTNKSVTERTSNYFDFRSIFTRINANLTGFQLTRPKTKPNTQQETWKSGESFPIPLVFIDYPPIVYYFSEHDLDFKLRCYDRPFQGRGGIKEKRKRLYDCIISAKETMTPEKREQTKAFYDHCKKPEAKDVDKDPFVIPMLFLDHPGAMRHFKESTIDFYLSKFGIQKHGLDSLQEKCKAVIDVIIAAKTANSTEVVRGRSVGKRPFPMPHVFYEDPTCVKFFDDFDINLYLALYAPAYRPQAQGHEDLRAKRKRLYNAILAAKAAKLPTSRDVQLGRKLPEIDRNDEKILFKSSLANAHLEQSSVSPPLRPVVPVVRMDLKVRVRLMEKQLKSLRVLEPTKTSNGNHELGSRVEPLSMAGVGPHAGCDVAVDGGGSVKEDGPTNVVWGFLRLIIDTLRTYRLYGGIFNVVGEVTIDIGGTSRVFPSNWVEEGKRKVFGRETGQGTDVVGFVSV
ncbi:hypothetical protein ONZ45_g15688 [Pleurotus djamor]|nr:hypothetical protein ONZ45_g15688 [Pleurotus djamor]